MPSSTSCRHLRVPTFAFINGLALGGGFELTLHCHYRTVSAAASGIALPECSLSLFPGWGGAFIVPNLIGADRAVQLIIENPLNQNRMLTGPQAYELGLADAIFDGADFLARSLDWAGQVVAGSLTVTRPEVDRGQAWDAALARGRNFVDGKVFGASPGPYRALELMAAAKDLRPGRRVRGRRRGTCRSDHESGTAGQPVRVRSCPEACPEAGGSTGYRAGPAGHQDRHRRRGLDGQPARVLFLRRLQVPVVITDLDQERVDKGLSYVEPRSTSCLASGGSPPMRQTGCGR